MVKYSFIVYNKEIYMHEAQQHKHCIIVQTRIIANKYTVDR